ncbi:hypothetical protein C8R45DRAFT_956120 [Mycena sanguinolenta]|nr:hypothetical protein C8R45DRAFT_956120 [Mycena sanguinolenta]
MSFLVLEQDTSAAHQTSRVRFSMRGVVLEQRERTRKSSKAEIERFIEESGLKITSLGSQINALVEVRDRERACVAALRHLITPIHTLPVELLADIFELTIHENTHVSDVFRISQVCSDWRQVAHSTPRLSTRPLRIDLRKLRRSDQEQVYVEGLKAWLFRSAPLTVPVSLRLDRPRSQRMTDDILGTALRWRSLCLNAPPQASSLFVSQLAQTRLDNLEELELGQRDRILDHGQAEDLDGHDPIALFAAVPRLRKLRMHIYSNTLSIVIPWGQLTELTLGAHCSNIALDILAHCANLVEVAISTTGRFSRPDAKQHVPVLSHLRVLALPFFGSGENAMPFLDHLSTPALEELSLDFGDLINPCWSEAQFIAFQRHAPNITRLELLYSDLTSDELRTAIHHAPSLTHLQLSQCHACFNDGLISALSYKPGVSPLAPHLHHLFVRDMGDNFTHNVLVGMIASRWWTDDQLGGSRQPPVARWTRVELLLNSDFGARDNRLNDLNLPSSVLIY